MTMLTCSIRDARRAGARRALLLQQSIKQQQPGIKQQTQQRHLTALLRCCPSSAQLNLPTAHHLFHTTRMTAASTSSRAHLHSTASGDDAPFALDKRCGWTQGDGVVVM